MTPTTPAQKLRRLFQRVLASQDEFVEEEPEAPTAQKISSIAARDRVHLFGEITSVESTPTGWQADFSDGTGRVLLHWLGRTRVPGVDQGTTMHVWGRVAAEGSDLMIYNPAYAIHAGRDDSHTSVD